MADNTAIEWTKNTWNPWQGCTHAGSPGCDQCYMYAAKKRYGQDPTVVVRSKDPTFWRPLKKGKTGWKSGEMVFVCSWSDFFHPAADNWRPQAWRIIQERPDLIFQILTKRPQYIAKRLPLDWGEGWPNVWLGATIEDQPRANERIPILLPIPAVVTFVSIEPMLGDVDLIGYLGTGYSPVKEERDNAETAMQGKGSLQGRDSRRDRNRQGRMRMAGGETRVVTMGKTHSDPHLQACTGGERHGRISNGENDDRQSATPYGGKSSGIPSLFRTDSGRVNGKPQGRQQKKQSPIESRIGNRFRAGDTRASRFATGQDRSKRREKCDGETYTESSGRDSGTSTQDRSRDEKPTREEDISTGSQVRSFIQRSVGGCSGNTLDFVIVGAETGAGKREMKTEWARDVKNQCVAAGVPFFFKKDSQGKRLLDGRTWEQFPEVGS